MFKKPTLTDIIKRDLANALELAHEHSKAAEHHEALMVMFSDRAERLQERLDAGDSLDSKSPARIFKGSVEDFAANGPKS